MTINEAKDEIKRRIPMTQYLEKSKSGMYCCPFCGSGTGPHKSGAVKVYEDTSTWYCHSCNKSGDVIDLYQNQTGTDFVTAVRNMAGEIGIEVDNSSSDQPQKNEENTDRSGKKQAVIQKKESKTDNNNYLKYYEQCTAQINNPAAVAYLNKRGISVDTAIQECIGFDPKSDPANAPGGQGEIKHPEPRIIIPTSPSHYVGRAIRDDVDKAYAKMNPKNSHPGILNFSLVEDEKNTDPIFVVEGAFDALSLKEIGVSAIAINSTSNAETFLKRLLQQTSDSKKRPANTFVISMDNDQSGQNATTILKQGLQEQRLSYICDNLAGIYNDINDRLVEDRDGLIEAVEKALQQCTDKPDNSLDYLDHGFKTDIDKFSNNLKTGFQDLDEKSGGLYSGLYIVAATSSLGKTTLLGQICDQLAASGSDVLYFSLEQSRLEMVTKSLARIIYQENPDEAVTSLAMRKGFLPSQVYRAMDTYKSMVDNRVSVIEGNFNCNASYIGDYVKKYIAKNDVKPVVIIDYIQILTPETIDGRQQTTKDVVDTTVISLKRLSRDLGITIIAVSSINRANYLLPIDLEALKESGNLEYTADVIWGLQLNCITCDPKFVKTNSITKKREIVKKEKAANPRKVDLVCLKNRYGIANFRSSFYYFPANDVFEQTTEFPDWVEVEELEAEDTPKAHRKIGGR